MSVTGLLSRSSQLSLAGLCLVIFVNEFLVYLMQSHRWPMLPNIDRSASQVVLLVADPQIQGYENELPFPVGSLARWDVDRYLRTTFSYVYDYCEPDVVVFLGDLFDEGSRATPREYTSTLDRFHTIFYQTKYTKTIYIPGDNDIGGEGRDMMTDRKARRFQQHFGNMTELVKFGFVDYIKLHVTPYGMTEDKVRAADQLHKKQTSPLTVLLNHDTVMTHPKHFIYPVTKRLRPKLVLSAHWHRAQFFTCDDCLADNEYSWGVKHNDLSDIDSYLHLPLGRQPDFLCELAVPTCSYRMGEANMGYGVLILGEDLSLQYTVLWLPRRYTMLLGYLLVLIIYAIVYVVNQCTRRR